MKKIPNQIIFILLLNFSYSITLQSVFDTAEPGNGYDKYLILDKNIIYTGEIGVYEGSVFIEGNGAIIDLNEGLGIWTYGEENAPTRLDIEYLTILNGGYNGLTFNGYSIGNITNCNFILNDFGIQIMDHSEVSVSNSNFINSGQYGFAMRGTTASFELNYSNFWQNNLGSCGYNENCWGITWVQLELQGNGIIEQNPLFENQNEWNFSYNEESPCIDAGDPNETDPDGSIKDIGARWYGDETTILNGNCSADNLLNILDVVFMINECILENINECDCGDLNQDNIVNVLDVVLIVNIILNN